jgi:hypothetical protein
MRKSLLILIFICGFTQLNAQKVFTGFTADWNSGIGERYTYGLGWHLEARMWRCENLYFNWHYSIGSNTHGELYGHGGLSLLLYKSDIWWRSGTGPDDALATLLGPLLIPNGVTYYLPQGPAYACKPKPMRIGIYCNPLAMDFWNMQPAKVTSWTVESGVKILYTLPGDQILYLSGGLSVTNNMRRNRPYGDYGNEELVHIQFGIMGVAE